VKRGIATLSLILILAGALAGCGDFQQRAQEAQARVDAAERKAETAIQAAADNTARVRELLQRVELLEARLDAATEAAD
jgi:hypothetical protein